MDSFIETFHIDWKILIAQGINFAIVFTILYIYALKPLNKLMAERRSGIKKGVDDAKKNELLIIKTQKEYDNVLAKAKIEANEIFQNGKKEADENKKELIEKAQADVENLINNGKKILESEKLKMVEEAKKEIVSLVVKSTEKLLELNPDKEFDNKILNEIKKL